MAANPFLYSEENYTSPSSTNSNPFLLGDEDVSSNTGFGDNPFLSQTAATISTNPFSFDPMELEPAEAEIPQMQQLNAPADPFGVLSGDSSLSTSNDTPFSSMETITAQPTSNDLINCSSYETRSSPQKPSDLDLKYSHSKPAQFPPRPLPPRVPPSKETQDLLMSVMGAMDATSSTLLDKIPPTRTPSPVSMRDLHSPCPTPEPIIEDLLDVSDKTQTSNTSNTKDIFSVDNSCDINQNPTFNITQEVKQKVVPPRPAPPARPPRPPLPPVVQQNITTVNSGKIEQRAEPLPAEEIDMFGVEVPQKPVTKADILNLYNAPKQEPIKDLLCDEEPDVIMQPPKENVTPMIISSDTKEVKNDVVSPLGPINDNNIVRDNLISPEPNQDDLQMDLSDSHSRESVCSVTLNPFAMPEEVAPTVLSTETINSINDLDREKMITFNSSGEQEVKKCVAERDVFGIAATASQVTETVNNISDDFEFGPSNTNIPNTQELFGFTQPVEVITNQQNVFAANHESRQTTDQPKDAFAENDDFDEFSKKFDSVKNDGVKISDAWGSDAANTADGLSGFGQEDGFDAFLALQEPPTVPQSTPNKISKAGSQESDDDKDFSVFIRPKGNEDYQTGMLPTIAPPPVQQAAFVDSSPRFNPFDSQNELPNDVINNEIPYAPDLKRTDSQETPPTPLYDEDVSQPLEPFPRTIFTEEGWEMHLRQPNKKKITGQRFWKKIFVKIVHQTDCVLLQLFNLKDDKDPFQELPLQPCYSVSDIGAQQYDQFGKIFTVKLQYIFYKERPGVRPGQVKKAERITNKLSQFAAYAIQGDYQGVKEFGSDLKKLGLPVEHAPQVSQLLKLGSLNYEDLKEFSSCIEEALFRLQAHRDRALHYKMEEVQITAVDELYVEQEAEGHVEKQVARVRLFFLGFLTGMPDIELGINDMRRQGKEVVGRHDIIPVVTEEWIRLEDVEFHSCVQQEDYNDTHIIKFKPPDACYIELMRFRVRPPKNRELPLQLKAQICITGYKVELRADVLVPGFTSRKLGQIPCEDVMIRFPIPECWIYMFRVEKHFRYGSVKSAHRRTGKIKGIERILGTMETLQENLIEVTSGQAKYEHQHRAIVWRCPRLPKEGQGAYTTHNMVCRIALTNFDQMPDKLAEYCYVEFTMPATQVSHTTCRSVSLQNSDSDEPPEKYVRYLARHEYRVGIERTEGESPNPYSAATFVSKAAPAPVEPAPAPAKVVEESSSDSD